MTNTDYYKILGVDKKATAQQIKKAYRKLAMKWHPDRNPNNKQQAGNKFKEIGEAYSVLGDETKRKNYDQFGSAKPFPQQQPGGTSGGPRSRSDGPQFQQAHFDMGNAEDIFRQFFAASSGSGSPGGASSMFGGASSFGGSPAGAPGGFHTFNLNSDAFSSSGRHSAGGFPQSQAPRQRPPSKGKKVEHTIHLSLRDLYKGGCKSMKVTRRRLNPDKRSTRQEVKLLTIHVKPGWKAGTKITFENEGDELPGVSPGDIQFTVAEKPHPRFQRKGNDLVCRQTIPLKNALLGDNRFTVRTLDGRDLAVHVKNPISAHSVKRVKNEGMPISKSAGRAKGDLLIEFDVVFPKNLSSQQRDMIQRYL